MSASTLRYLSSLLWYSLSPHLHLLSPFTTAMVPEDKEQGCCYTWDAPGVESQAPQEHDYSAQEPLCESECVPKKGQHLPLAKKMCFVRRSESLSVEVNATVLQLGY